MGFITRAAKQSKAKQSKAKHFKGNMNGREYAITLN